MTGYLGRLVERANGGEAGATPRLPSRFEASSAGDVRVDRHLDPAPGPVLDPGRDQLDRGLRAGSEPAARTVTSRAAHDSSADPLPRSRTVPRRVPSLLTRADRSARPSASDPSVGSTTQRETPTSVARPAVPERSESPVPLAAPAAAGGTVGLLDPASMPTVRAAPTVVSAIPVTPGVSTAAELTPAVERGPDVVHVSIGRIEVRATIAPPGVPAPPQRPTPEAKAQPEALSLQDYLSGRRDAR